MGDPYREASPPEDAPEAPDLDPELTTKDGHRTRALLVTKDELAAGGVRSLEHRPLVRCASCEGKGCELCKDRGANVDKIEITVRFQPGAVDGDVVTLEGKGDVPGLRRDRVVGALPDRRGDLLVRVGTSKKESRTIENADRRRRRRQRDWLEARAVESYRARTGRRRGVIMLAVLVVGLAGLWFVAWVRKGSFGDTCAGPGECRSGLCIESTGFILGKGGFTDRTCSTRCTVDADCVGGTVCVDIEEHDSIGNLTGKTIRACGHR